LALAPELIDEVLGRFLMLDPEFLEPFDAATSALPTVLSGVVAAFRANLEATITVAMVPHLLTVSSVETARFQRLHAVERIRSLKWGADGRRVGTEEDARRIAEERFIEDMRTPSVRGAVRDAVVASLAELLKDERIEAATRVLLLETLVMAWGTFEALATDVIRLLLNTDARRAVALMNTDTARKHFPRGLPIDALAAHGFNVATRMGDVLLGDRGLDTLPTVKDILSVLLPHAPELHRTLSQPALWLLWQRRHLAVHRRGGVDAAYIAKTSEELAPGSRLTVTADEVEGTLVLIREVGAALCSAAGECETQTVGDRGDPG
jgi:hypothetical protein